MDDQRSEGSSRTYRLQVFLAGLLLGGLAGAAGMMWLAPRAAAMMLPAPRVEEGRTRTRQTRLSYRRRA